MATKENNVLPNEESVSLNFIPPAGQWVGTFYEEQTSKKNELVARPSHHTIKMDALMRLQKREEMMCCP